MENKWLIVYRFFLIGFILFSLYFGTPIIGINNFHSLVVDRLGCSVPFDYIEPCIIYGYDIAPRFMLYKLPLINILITPIAYAVAFFEIIIIWVSLIFFFKFMDKRKKRKW